MKKTDTNCEEVAVRESPLSAVVYAELRKLARKYMSRERRDHTLQATALVHEALLKLQGIDLEYDDKVHFLSTVARQMRRVLVDHARAKTAGRRGGKLEMTSFTQGMGLSAETEPDFVLVNQAIDALGHADPRAQLALDLCYFTGKSQVDVASDLEVSLATLQRDLKFARAFVIRSVESYG